MAHDLRAVLRLAAGKNAAPSAAILDSRTLQSTPESDARAGFDGAKKRKGSKVHAAVDTLGHLLALKVTAADEQDRAQVGDLAQALQAATGENVELAYVDQGYTGEKPAAAAQEHGLRLEVVKHHEAKWALSCCPGAGWWSGPSPGPRASGGWPATTSGSPTPWPPITGSLSPSSCFIPSLPKVHDRL